MPKFEIENVYPVISLGSIFPSFALHTISLTSIDICSNRFKLVFYNTGTYNPVSVWTSTPIWTFLYSLMESPIQAELV